MKISRQTKDAFMQEFSNRQFTLDEVIQWLEPHMLVDDEKAIEQYKKNACRNFIASFKDDNGIRHFFSFKSDDGIKYTFSSGKLDMDVAKSILQNLNSKQRGLYKASRKIRRGIQIFQGQIDMFDKQQDAISK